MLSVFIFFYVLATSENTFIAKRKINYITGFKTVKEYMCKHFKVLTVCFFFLFVCILCILFVYNSENIYKRIVYVLLGSTYHSGMLSYKLGTETIMSLSAQFKRGYITNPELTKLPPFVASDILFKYLNENNFSLELFPNFLKNKGIYDSPVFDFNAIPLESKSFIGFYTEGVSEKILNQLAIDEGYNPKFYYERSEIWCSTPWLILMSNTEYLCAVEKLINSKEITSYLEGGKNHEIYLKVAKLAISVFKGTSESHWYDENSIIFERL